MHHYIHFFYEVMNMMRSYMKKIEFYSALAVMILGTLLHFAYSFSGQNYLVSFLAPVNESVWEHLKMVFYPVFLVTVFDSLLFRQNNIAFFYCHSTNVLIGMAFLIIAYYTYSGILGFSVIFADVALFYLTVILIHVLNTKGISKERSVVPYSFPGVLIFLLTAAIFILFTLYPPKIGLFLPPPGA